MSAGTLALVRTPPRTGTRSADVTGPAAPARPRLLLPPVHEPGRERTATEAAALMLPLVRSVRSPVTDRLWPVPAAVVDDTPAPLPDPTRLCGSLVLAAVEALAGTRPLVQLTRWVTPQVMEALATATATAATTPAPGARAPGAPALGTAPGGAPRGAFGSAARSSAPGRATVRRTHLTRVSPTVAEASVVLHDGRRVRGAAVRLEVHRGHWRATVLQIG